MTDNYAFPTVTGCGLTKREWFAGHALVGIIAQTDVAIRVTDLAKEAFIVADAMIAESEKS